jgi:hypothetical protein
MAKENKGVMKLKLGRKTYTIHYTFLPAKREHNASPESFRPPSVEVNHITKRGRRLKEDKLNVLITEYKEYIQEEALKVEWQKRAAAIIRILEGRQM